eukprot:4110869-Lingulodinium_polyedra.AAC.1
MCTTDDVSKSVDALVCHIDPENAEMKIADLGRAPDQSSRHADLTLTEEGLIQGGKHVLVSYIMKPKPGYDYLSTAAHFAAESSHG